MIIQPGAMVKKSLPIFFLCAVLSGCTSLGPKTISHDRPDYSDSISDSWKRQTLLNIIKLRYVDPPVWVDVGQIVAGYSMETTISGGASFANTTAGSVGAAAKYTDRPTITYMPLTGNKFIKALMTPLPPEAVFFTVQSGWPADSVFSASLASINGLKNQEISIAGVSAPDPDFLRALELLRKIQLSGAVGMRVQQDSKKQETDIITFRTKGITEETLAQVHELRDLLKLDQNTQEFKMTFGNVAADDKELAVVTRSLLHIMGSISALVEVPAEDVAQGRAVPGINASATAGTPASAARIHCSNSKPSDAYVSVRYRDHWFWIDDRDLKTKRAFAFIMMLFTLTDTGEKEPLPLITIPAQ